ncbi:MAG: TrmH family RNA methyltransferase [bacterium]|nr:TrmH family RNA methyltransferase [bacterium]
MITAVLLHNIRSAHNVGAIFRTADAAGVSHVYITGYTPSPIDRFGRTSSAIAKTALGAESSTQWEHRASAAKLIAGLRADGWRVVGVEQDARSQDYRALRVRDKTLFVFGNEVRGLSKPLRDSCDELVEIPMHGEKESLNVSVAAGVILFSCAR